ncbi:MAG TPA: hypothetical protein VK610_04640, partial [Rhodothermales bacterium]|nr:hypothetical protein [Rhodothermales bacterium]
PGLRAFPNPASDLVTMVVSGVDDGPVRVEVIDALGRRVGVTEGRSLAGTVRLAWDGGQAAAGRYTLRVVGRPEIEPVSVVISR